MIAIAEPYPAEFRCGSRWQPCDVVGVCGDPHDLKFVVIVRGPTDYVDVVAEVRRPERAPGPFG
jgi:hypothetical protein